MSCAHVKETYILTMIRTRAIIKNLSHDSLVKEGIIPDLSQIISQSPTTIAVKRYPPFVYSNDDDGKFAFFGMLLDYIVRAGLRINLAQPFVLGQDPNIDTIQELDTDKMIQAVTDLNVYETSKNMNDIVRTSLTLTSIMYDKHIYSPENIQKYVPTVVNIMKELVAKWNVYSTYLVGTIRFNTEYSYRNFSGHPDIVTDNSVLDIKNTCSFVKMSKESCLQVLAYYALMKQTIPTMQYVGFVLPMQRELTLYNVSTWDPTRYLELLSSEANKLTATIPQDLVMAVETDGEGNIDMDMLTAQLMSIGLKDEQIKQILPQQVVMGNNTAKNVIYCPPVHRIEGNNLPITIGSHIAKGADITKTLRRFTTERPGDPCQMFLGNPRTGKRNPKTAGQVAAAAQLIKDTKLQYFTHAAYIINLCSNPNDNGDYWGQRYLNEDLDLTVALGGKGVIVHTGARKHLPEDEALTIMEYMIRMALPHATETCPLLLETPCGEGTEVVTKIEDLGNFFFRFTSEERKKLGLCVDTCHIFSAGYDPLAYLQHWEKHCPVPVKLVHFNDSQRECGACVDRHASPGQGYIGLEKMILIADWCSKRFVPMVTE